MDSKDKLAELVKLRQRPALDDLVGEGGREVSLNHNRQVRHFSLTVFCLYRDHNSKTTPMATEVGYGKLGV